MATQAGDYAVILGNGSCADTSTCYTINALGLDDLLRNNAPKTLIKIVNYLGQETAFKLNTPLIYIYSDGTREKIVKFEF
jgi:hypothetical protein